MTRQQRRAEERAKRKGESHKEMSDRIMGEVEAALTIRDLWLMYYNNRFERIATRPLEPEHIELLQEVFYSGVAAMFKLLDKAAEPESEDESVARLRRLQEELQTFTKRLG